jgi:ABC-type lipopolysaccharide export system ATPase subunit
MNPIAIGFDGVSKFYGRIRAVKKVSLTVRSGECFGLLGPNGAPDNPEGEVRLGMHFGDSPYTRECRRNGPRTGA